MRARRPSSRPCMARAMSSASASRPTEGADGRSGAMDGRSGGAGRFARFGRALARLAPRSGLSPWPRSLFGRLLVSVLAAVLLAQTLTFTLVARERNKFVIETNVREWSRRIVDLTYALQLLDPSERAAARARLEQWPPRRFFRYHLAPFHERLAPAEEGAGARDGSARSAPLASSNFREALEAELVRLLGPDYGVTVRPTANLLDRAITVTRQPPEGVELGGRLYDVRVTLPDRDALTFRGSQGRRGPLFPRGLLLNLALLTLATA